MDKIGKFLKKLSYGERITIEDIIKRVISRDFFGLDMKKLKGEDNRFRVRKGGTRIIFIKEENEIKILSVERKSDNTYK